MNRLARLPARVPRALLSPHSHIQIVLRRLRAGLPRRPEEKLVSGQGKDGFCARICDLQTRMNTPPLLSSPGTRAGMEREGERDERKEDGAEKWPRSIRRSISGGHT